MNSLSQESSQLPSFRYMSSGHLQDDFLKVSIASCTITVQEGFEIPTGIQEYRNTGIQEYRNTEIQEYRNTGIQVTGIQEYRLPALFHTSVTRQSTCVVVTIILRAHRAARVIDKGSFTAQVWGGQRVKMVVLRGTESLYIWMVSETTFLCTAFLRVGSPINDNPSIRTFLSVGSNTLTQTCTVTSQITTTDIIVTVFIVLCGIHYIMTRLLKDQK